MTPYFYNQVKENKCSLSFQTQQPTSETLPEQSLCFPESCQVQQWMWHQAQVLEPAGEQGLTAKSCLHPQHRCLSPGCLRAALTPLCTTLTLCALPWAPCKSAFSHLRCLCSKSTAASSAVCICHQDMQTTALKLSCFRLNTALSQKISAEE